MAFKYENGKVVQVTPPHVIGEDAEKMLNAKPPKKIIQRVKKKKFVVKDAA